MSNKPSDSSESPKGRKNLKRKPAISITCIIDSILQLRGSKNIIIINGHDSGKHGNKHPITLYGSTLNIPRFNIDSINRLVSFRVRLISVSIAGDANKTGGIETERVGNIVEYYGGVDTNGKFFL